MKSTSTVVSVLALTALSVARPVPGKGKIEPREVPQEHSHEQFLTSVRDSLRIDNPDNIGDPVFGLLGNGAAAAGLGQIADVECLQQATADRAFTNAKAAGDVDGMTSALIYRALERNTQKVGQASNLCTSIQAVNPEIAAITQHQDPASVGAAETNKAITLELAAQIAAIGGDPLLALQSGTFAPGDLNDNTGKGNTCDDANDAIGCIFSQNLLVEDVTAAEITAAASGGAAQQQATGPVGVQSQNATAPSIGSPNNTAQNATSQPILSQPIASQPAAVPNNAAPTDVAQNSVIAQDSGAQDSGAQDAGAQNGAQNAAAPASDAQRQNTINSWWMTTSWSS